MAKIKSDIEIARASKIKPISDILKKYNIPDNHSTFSPCLLYTSDAADE